MIDVTVIYYDGNKNCWGYARYEDTGHGTYILRECTDQGPQTPVQMKQSELDRIHSAEYDVTAIIRGYCTIMHLHIGDQ